MKILKKIKNMIRGIHYISTGIKQKLMLSQGAALNINKYEVIFTHLLLWVAVARHNIKWVKI